MLINEFLYQPLIYEEHMSSAFSTAPQRQSFWERLVRRPLTSLVAGLLAAVSLTASDGNSVSSSLVGTFEKTFGMALLIGTRTVSGTTSYSIWVERFNTESTLSYRLKHPCIGSASLCLTL